MAQRFHSNVLSNELPALGALPQILVSELVSTVRFSARMLLPVPVAVPLSALPPLRPIFGGDWPVHARMGPIVLPMTPPYGVGWPVGLQMMGISSELIILTMHMIPEEMPRPRRPDSHVAEIGTTWTHAGAALSGQPAPSAHTGSMFPDSVAREVALARAAEVAWLQVETCGICFEPFEPGHSLTSMPCAREGCKSVWHTDCIREWLARSRALSCPLCRTVTHVAGDIGSSGAVGGGLGDFIWMEEPVLRRSFGVSQLREDHTHDWFRHERVLAQQQLELAQRQQQQLGQVQQNLVQQQQLELPYLQQWVELAQREQLLATPQPHPLPAYGGRMPATRLAHPGQAPPRQAPPRQVPPRQAPQYSGASGTGAGLVSTQQIRQPRPNFVRLVQWSPGASAGTAAGQPPQGAHPFGAGLGP